MQSTFCPCRVWQVLTPMNISGRPRGGAQALILGKKEEMIEERKASRVSKWPKRGSIPANFFEVICMRVLSCECWVICSLSHKCSSLRTTVWEARFFEDYVPKDIPRFLKMSESIQTCPRSSKDKFIKLAYESRSRNSPEYSPVPVTAHIVSLNATSISVLSIWRRKYHHLHIVFISYISLSLPTFGNFVK